MESRAAIVVSVQAGTSPQATVLCLQAVAEQARVADAELFLVGAGDDPAQLAAIVPSATPITCAGTPAEFRNVGAFAATGGVLVFIDSAYVPSPGWLNALLSRLALETSLAIVGGVTLTSQQKIHNAGLAVNYGEGPPISVTCIGADQTPAAFAFNEVKCRALPASGLAIRAKVFHALGGFDASFKNCGDDVDLCLRAARVGHALAVERKAELTTQVAARYPLSRYEGDHLEFHVRWLSTLEEFDSDIRHNFKGSAPKALSATRPPMTVISVMLPGTFSTLGSWLEITRATLGPNDDWLIVDASNHEGNALYGQWMVRHTHGATFMQVQDASYRRAVETAVAAAKADLIALPAPNAVPSWHWLERSATHLLKVTEHGSANIVAASLPVLGTSAPVERALDLNVVQRALLAPLAGVGAVTAQPETFCFVARKSALAQAVDMPGFPAGPVHTAFDVWSTQLATPARPVHQLQAMVTVQNLAAANLAYEAQYAGNAEEQSHSKAAGEAPYPGIVSIVVPVLNQPSLTRTFLESVYANTNRPFEIILVDNGSALPVQRLVTEFQKSHDNLVYVRNPRNEGFGYACNQGMACARGDVVVVINNDVQVPSGWLSRMLAVLAADANVGMVGPATNRCVGDQQIVPAPYEKTQDFAGAAAARAITHRGNVRGVNRLVGLCLMIPRSVLDKVGGFDPAYGYGNFEDDDLGLRIRRAGFSLAVADDVLLHHEGSATFVAEGFDASALAQQNWEIFCDKWRHDSEQANFTAVEQLAQQAPFSRANDFIPLRFSEQFSAQGEGLTLETSKPVKLLFTPDVFASEWSTTLRTFLTTFGPDDPVALVLRPEPATHQRVQRALAEASALLGEMATSKALPVVLLEGTKLPPLARASLYRAVDAWIETPGPLCPFIEREAQAVGLTTVVATSEAMRSFVHNKQGSAS